MSHAVQAVNDRFHDVLLSNSESSTMNCQLRRRRNSYSLVFNVQNIGLLTVQ